MPTKIYPPRAPRLSTAALKHPSMRWAAPLIRDPNILHLNRESVSLAVFIGVLVAFLPIARPDLRRSRPGPLVGRQPAPLNLLCIWISNPFTIAPLFFSDLSRRRRSARQRASCVSRISLTWEWFSGLWRHQILLPLDGRQCCSAAWWFRRSRAGYLLINFLWRWKVITQLGKAQAGTPATV